MARTGKPAGNKKTSFGKRTEAEKSFRDRKKETRGESSQRSGRGKFSGLQNFHLHDLTKRSRKVKVVHHLENLMQTGHSKKSRAQDLEEMEKAQPQEKIDFRGPPTFPKPRFDSDKPRDERKSSFGKSDSRPFRDSKEQSHSPVKEMMIRINLQVIEDSQKRRWIFFRQRKEIFLNHLKKGKKELIGFLNSKKKMKDHLEPSPMAILVLKSLNEKKENLKILPSQKRKSLSHLD